MALELVHHRGVHRVDGDAAGLLLLVVVQGELAARQVEAHQAGARQQAVRQGRLAVIDVGHGADVPDVLQFVHQLFDFAYVVFLSSHGHHLGVS